MFQVTGFLFFPSIWARPDNRSFMAGQEVGRTVAKVVPSVHLVTRCRKRLGDLSPNLEVGVAFPLSGVLVVDRTMQRPCKFYLDVGGVGRFVLAQEGDKFVGVAFLPRIYSRDLGPGTEVSPR